MPRLRHVAALALGCLLVVTGASARSGTPPMGRTMAPTESSCLSSLCHSGPGPAGVQIQLLDGAAAFTTYTPGQLYTLTLGVGGGAGRLRWGFEMTCLTTVGAARAGTFTAGADRLTTKQATATREYISHFSSALPPPVDGTFDNNPGPVSWTFTWQAPAAGPAASDVIFYVCANAADSSGTSVGDAIRCTTFPVTVAAGPLDTDGDTLPDSAETGTCTSPTDADTDDDGVSDGAELMAASPTNPCRCDTDNDGLPDGLELGVDTPLRDTSVGAGCFVADLDTNTTTNPNSADTDGDSPDAVLCLDGVEDANGNGRVDLPGETDPNNPGDCPVATGLDLRIDGRATSLMNGGPADCGLLTTPAIANWMLTPCSSPRTTGCDPAAVLPTTRVVTINPGQPGPDLTLTGEAAASFEPGVLTYYEIDGCSVQLLVAKSGADLLLDTQ